MASLAELNEMRGQTERLGEFATVVRCLLLSQFNWGEAQQIAEQIGTPRVKEVFKSNPGAISDPDWSSLASPYSMIAQSFVGSLAKWTVYDELLNSPNGFLKLPPYVRVTTTTSFTSSVVNEGKPVPVRTLTTDHTDLTPQKTAADVAFSNELAKFSGPRGVNLILAELRKAVVPATDATFIALITDSTTAGPVPVVNSTGLTTSTFEADLMNALDNVVPGPTSSTWVVCSPHTMRRIAFMHGTDGALAYPGLTISGGEFAGLQFRPSDQVSGEIVIFDATRIAAVDSPNPLALVPATQATYEASDDPTDSPVQLRSLWQRNEIGVRATRKFGVKLIDHTAVCVIEDVSA